MSLPDMVERALERDDTANWDSSFAAKRPDGTLKPKNEKELKGWQAQKVKSFNQYLTRLQQGKGGKDAGRLNKKAAKAKI